MNGAVRSVVSGTWLAAGLLAAAALAPPAAADPPPDLAGIWVTDAGEEVEVRQIPASGRVFATFTARSSNGVCPIVSPPNDRRTYFIDGLLSGDTLQGKLMSCTKSEKLVGPCGMASAYETSFTAKVTASRISGTFLLEGVQKQPPDARGCEYALSPARNKDQSFFLERCVYDSKRLCAAFRAARTSATRLFMPEKSPTEAEWAQALEAHRPRLESELSQASVLLCDDGGPVAKLDAMRQTLASLGTAEEPLLAQRLKAASIDIGLEALEQSRCAAPVGVVKASSCQELSLPALDAMKAYMDRFDEMKPGLVPDEQAYEQVRKGLHQALDQVVEEARSARDGASTAGDADQYLVEQQSKLKTLRDLLGYWDQVKAASCVPTEVLELLRRLAAEKRSGGDTGDTCNQLCGATADWVARMTGDGSRKKELFESCGLSCN
jgi:hypothetical protein